MSAITMTPAEIVAALRAIDGPAALEARVEYELEELDLITTDHLPYAELTDEGRAVADGTLVWIENLRGFAPAAWAVRA